MNFFVQILLLMKAQPIIYLYMEAIIKTYSYKNRYFNIYVSLSSVELIIFVFLG